MGSRMGTAIAALLVLLMVMVTGCGGDRATPTVLLEGNPPADTVNPLVGRLAEVSPPERIQQLKPFLDVYEPQVRIVSPQPDQVLDNTTVEVSIQVRDLPIYKDVELGLGPHLHLFLDDQPYQAVYDPETPIVLTDLPPGTHTLRVFASRPWHESFKNEGAYDQVSFNVLTDSPQNRPDENQILLTYSRPQGHYGAEPIMLDFYLRNAPLPELAEADETLPDWRIRCTINGEAFVFDRWQPLYLTGFQPGNNWVKLEVIDDTGRTIDNTYNTAIRLIDYTPGGDDGLSRLVRGEIPLSQARVLVDPDYVPPAAVAPEATPVETAEPTPAEQPAPEAAAATETQDAPQAPESAPEAPTGETAAAAEPTSSEATPSQPTPPAEQPAPAAPPEAAAPPPEPSQPSEPPSPLPSSSPAAPPSEQAESQSPAPAAEAPEVESPEAGASTEKAPTEEQETVPVAPPTPEPPSSEAELDII